MYRALKENLPRDIIDCIGLYSDQKIEHKNAHVLLLDPRCLEEIQYQKHNLWTQIDAEVNWIQYVRERVPSFVKLAQLNRDVIEMIYIRYCLEDMDYGYEYANLCLFHTRKFNIVHGRAHAIIARKLGELWFEHYMFYRKRMLAAAIQNGHFEQQYT